MLEKYIDSFKNLSEMDKKEVIIDEMVEVINTIETIAKVKKIDITKLKSEYYIRHKSRLVDEDFYNLVFKNFKCFGSPADCTLHSPAIKLGDIFLIL